MESIQDILEVQVVDATSLSDTIEMLINICHAKAEHLESNWQDRDAARAWEKAAGKIAWSLNKVKDLGL